MTGGRNLAFWGLTFLPPYGAAHLLEEPGTNIAAANKVLFYLLTG